MRLRYSGVGWWLAGGQQQGQDKREQMYLRHGGSGLCMTVAPVLTRVYKRSVNFGPSGANNVAFWPDVSQPAAKH